MGTDLTLDEVLEKAEKISDKAKEKTKKASENKENLDTGLIIKTDLDTNKIISGLEKIRKELIVRVVVESTVTLLLSSLELIVFIKSAISLVELNMLRLVGYGFLSLLLVAIVLFIVTDASDLPHEIKILSKLNKILNESDIKQEVNKILHSNLYDCNSIYRSIFNLLYADDIIEHNSADLYSFAFSSKDKLNTNEKITKYVLNIKRNRLKIEKLNSENEEETKHIYVNKIKVIDETDDEFTYTENRKIIINITNTNIICKVPYTLLDGKKLKKIKKIKSKGKITENK